MAAELSLLVETRRTIQSLVLPQALLLLCDPRLVGPLPSRKKKNNNINIKGTLGER